MGLDWVLAITLEVVFGVSYALLLHGTKVGRYLKYQLTWITVIIGVGGTGLIGAIVLDWRTVGKVALLFGMSAIGIISGEIWAMYRRYEAMTLEIHDD